MKVPKPCLTYGFFPDPDSAAKLMLKVATMVALGLTALAAWVLGAVILFGERVARIVTTIAAAEFVLYVVCLLFFSQSFFVAIVNYLPSAVFVLGVFGAVGFRHRSRAAWVGVAARSASMTRSGLHSRPALRRRT